MRKKKKRRINLLHIILVCILLYAGGTFAYCKIQINKLKEEKNIMQQKLEALEDERKALEYEYEHSNDIKYVERVAREELKMVKRNEIIYIDTFKSSKP